MNPATRAPIGKPPTAIQRNISVPLVVVGVVSAAVAFIPGVGGGLSGLISHGLDRVRNSGKANNEMKLRANYYQDQVRAELGYSADRPVNVQDFMLASQKNPLLLKARREVELERNKENRESGMMNAGVAAAGLIGAGGVARLGADASKMAKMGALAVDAGKGLAGGLAGTTMAGMFSKNEVSSQEVMERIHNCMLEAQQKNMPNAVMPNVVFLLRVSQDEKLGKEIKQQYSKPFHKMNDAEQGVVMNTYSALTNAVTSEAHALNQGIMPPQELMARAPNLNAAASRYAGAGRSGSFAQDIQARRMAAANAQPALG